MLEAINALNGFAKLNKSHGTGPCTALKLVGFELYKQTGEAA